MLKNEIFSRIIVGILSRDRLFQRYRPFASARGYLFCFISESGTHTRIPPGNVSQRRLPANRKAGAATVAIFNIDFEGAPMCFVLLPVVI
jgi:hypothetical protein